MKNNCLLCLLLLCAATAVQAQKKDKKLQASIQTLLQGFHGDVGIYVHDLERNRTVAINADADQ